MEEEVDNATEMPKLTKAIDDMDVEMMNPIKDTTKGGEFEDADAMVSSSYCLSWLTAHL